MNDQDEQITSNEPEDETEPVATEKEPASEPVPEPEPAKEPIVCVNDVSVVFNVANEKIQSLKEYFIKLSRRELMFKKFVAVDDVSFQVNRGDVFGLVGTNGSGKSTLLKVIAGVLAPSTGTCTVNGTISPLIELGAGFDMELTARENIYLNGALLGYSKKFLDERVDDIIEFAELHDFMEMPLKNYSSGMTARIAFAIATVTEPDLLIVDEVLAVGDFIFRQKCEKRITEMIEHGTTVLIVSHDLKQIKRLCNRVMWIEKSKMQMIGSTEEVCAAYKAFGGGDDEDDEDSSDKDKEATETEQLEESEVSAEQLEEPEAPAEQLEETEETPVEQITEETTEINADDNPEPAAEQIA